MAYKVLESNRSSKLIFALERVIVDSSQLHPDLDTKELRSILFKLKKELTSNPNWNDIIERAHGQMWFGFEESLRVDEKKKWESLADLAGQELCK